MVTNNPVCQLVLNAQYRSRLHDKQIVILKYFDDFTCGVFEMSTNTRLTFGKEYFLHNFEFIEKVDKNDNKNEPLLIGRRYRHIQDGKTIATLLRVDNNLCWYKYERNNNEVNCSEGLFRDSFELVEEEEDNKQQFSTGAVRSNDANGVRYDLISPIGLRQLAETYAEGAKKYGDYNWKKSLPIGDTLNHLIRHIELWRSGDRSEPHLAHAAWGLFTLMHFEERYKISDDEEYKELFEEYNNDSNAN